MTTLFPTILITGGASGLGRALAELAGKRGYRVAIADTNSLRADETCKALADMDIGHMYIPCDVRKEADLRLAVERVVSRWGQLDIMVNNAGVAAAGLFEMIPAADWEWIVDINLMGVVRGCRAALTAMKRQGGGHIVNIASMAGLTPPPGMSSYNVSKAGVVSLSESLHSELAPLGIQVSVACPSFFKTNLSDSLRTPDPVTRARFEKLLESQSYSADEIAEHIFCGIEKKQFLILPHPAGKRAWRNKRWRPARFYQAMIALGRKMRA
ncbi:SDR family oxidoreductase [Alcanivorax sp. JB21]|uniref:SDR family oxidoreductase n=1 Tax=Alcanivorax limicola TaxID=2874102 RepID=UPI001CBD8E10|nr:SDR family oxidoreductase [Alcanivorax limicola]MBZ2187651.1 SDR family oxidoreductase [Alcanivorax limicola]